MKKIESLESFSFSIGGYSTSIFKIRALYNVAHYEAAIYQGRPEVIRNISYKDEQLHELVSVLNEIEVLYWEDEYVSDILDGTQWELKLNYNRKKEKKVFGSNMYPGLKENSEDPTEIFEQMIQAFAVFIGEEKFFEERYLYKK